ncbi:MAG: hypothetical protein IJ419_10070 [Agathobacter sp.]|nr:hypothetical protein [Agathobacter sp.]
MSEQNLNEEFTTPVEKQKTGGATVALVLGILSILTVVLFINYILGLIAIILAIVFLVKKDRKKGKIRAGIGLGLAVVSIAVSTFTWVSIYTYFTTTPVTKMMEDIKVVTGGQIDPEQIVNNAIDEYVNEVIDTATLEKVEGLLGKELNYQSLSEFVGEEVTVETVQNFVGNGEITAERVQEVVSSIDQNAVLEDLGGEITYKALEEKVGKDFTYDDLMQYLEGFKK